MSRLGKLPIDIASGVKVAVNGSTINVEGPKGKLDYTFPEPITVKAEDAKIVVDRPNDEAQNKALHGLVWSLVRNMVKGVSDGFEKTLIIKGVGYRAAIKGKSIGLTLGFSHPVNFPLPDSVTAKIDGPTTLILQSPDKALLGNVAAKIRSLRPPEPYQGKGIRYSDETIRRKAGKSASK